MPESDNLSNEILFGKRSPASSPEYQLQQEVAADEPMEMSEQKSEQPEDVQEESQQMLFGAQDETEQEQLFDQLGVLANPTNSGNQEAMPE